eukprot:jgi/Chlat1/4937/Chrsp31S04852
MVGEPAERIGPGATKMKRPQRAASSTPSRLSDYVCDVFGDGRKRLPSENDSGTAAISENGGKRRSESPITFKDDERLYKRTRMGAYQPMTRTVGCSKCRHSLAGCKDCRVGPKLCKVRWKPGDGRCPKVEPAPTFRPTEEEFRDLLQYIASIRPVAEKYGACLIEPPPSWQPRFAFDMHSAFETKVQELHRLQNRGGSDVSRSRASSSCSDSSPPLTPSTSGADTAGVRPERSRSRRDARELSSEPEIEQSSAEGEGLDTAWHRKTLFREQYLQFCLQENRPSQDPVVENVHIDLERLYVAVRKRGKFLDVAQDEGAWADIKQELSLPTAFDIYDLMATYRDHKLVEFETYQKASAATGPKGMDGGRMGSGSAASPSTCEFGFHIGDTHTMQTFEHFANRFKQLYFSNIKPKGRQPTIAEIEGEFWRIVETASDEVEVIYGTDLQSDQYGSGFPVPAVKSSKSDMDIAHAQHSWNLLNIAHAPGSMLRYLNEAISGVASPWVYFGMCFSTFCWHAEDHYLYSINYHHWGEPKIWYTVPGSHVDAFETAMRKSLPHLFEGNEHLLQQLVTQLSPTRYAVFGLQPLRLLFVKTSTRAIRQAADVGMFVCCSERRLQQENVPVYRVQQNARNFVVTFPGAYHGGFNAGYNCAEAVNVAPADWLSFGRQAVAKYRRIKRGTTLAHDKLLLTLAKAVAEECFSPDRRFKTAAIQTAKHAAPAVLGTLREFEREYAIAQERGMKCSHMPATERWHVESSECWTCNSELRYTAAVCDCNLRRGSCIAHASKLCHCKSQTGRKQLIYLRCKVCDGDLYLSAVSCSCRDHEFAVCVEHAGDACPCKPNRQAFHFRFTPEELRAIHQKAAQAAELPLPAADDNDGSIPSASEGQMRATRASQRLAQKAMGSATELSGVGGLPYASGVGIRGRSISKYTGVTHTGNASLPFEARILRAGKSVLLGQFASEKQAASCWDHAFISDGGAVTGTNAHKYPADFLEHKAAAGTGAQPTGMDASAATSPSPVVKVEATASVNGRGSPLRKVASASCTIGSHESRQQANGHEVQNAASNTRAQHQKQQALEANSASPKAAQLAVAGASGKLAESSRPPNPSPLAPGPASASNRPGQVGTPAKPSIAPANLMQSTLHCPIVSQSLAVTQSLAEQQAASTSLTTAPKQQAAAHSRSPQRRSQAAQDATVPDATVPSLDLRLRDLLQPQLVCVGQIVQRPGWHNSRYIFPAGYVVHVLFPSSLQTERLLTHRCEILEDGPFAPSPTFKVTSLERPNDAVLAKNPRACFEQLRDRLKAAGTVTSTYLSFLEIQGVDLFGLPHPDIEAAIEQLDAEHSCKAYWAAKRKRVKRAEAAEIVQPAIESSEAAAGTVGREWLCSTPPAVRAGSQPKPSPVAAAVGAASLSGPAAATAGPLSPASATATGGTVRQPQRQLLPLLQQLMDARASTSAVMSPGRAHIPAPLPPPLQHQPQPPVRAQMDADLQRLRSMLLRANADRQELSALKRLVLLEPAKLLDSINSLLSTFVHL